LKYHIVFFDALASCLQCKEFTNQWLVFSSFFPFLKKAAPKGQPFLVVKEYPG